MAGTNIGKTTKHSYSMIGGEMMTKRTTVSAAKNKLFTAAANVRVATGQLQAQCAANSAWYNVSIVLQDGEPVLAISESAIFKDDASVKKLAITDGANVRVAEGQLQAQCPTNNVWYNVSIVLQDGEPVLAISDA